MELNPDNAALTQVREHWQKLFAVLLWKISPQGVTITLADLQEFERQQAREFKHLLTHGHRESFEFRFVTDAEARRLAAHDQATHSGRA